MIRGFFCMLVVAVWTTLLFPVCVLVMIVRARASASLWVVRKLWSPVLLWAGGATLSVSGQDHVDPRSPAVFVANHQSTIDVPALFVALPVTFVFAAKMSLKYVPVLGWYMSLAKFIFVDRANTRRAIASLEEAAATIRSGVNLVMFPEGTRSESLKVMPFKKGPFALAQRANVPVIPVAIEGSGALMPKNSWNIHPGPIRVAIGKPIRVADFGDDRLALMREVRTAIIELHRSIGGLGGDVEAVSAKEERRTA